ncbi:unnamed protein product [Cochlearia groenlandica]
MVAGENRTLPENLKKQLSVSVRNIQWSYGIFWSVSASQPGRSQSRQEVKADKLGLERSEQLRELYDSLSVAESSTSGGSQVTRRSSAAALSPEDLTDTEWYYLVCMSFVFNIDEGIPGGALANGEPIWLCNAHTADSKVFTRSLLAKSASLQTVVCFPFLGGVLEIGTTEHITEDLNVIQCVKTLFLESPPYATISTRSDYQEIFDHIGDNKYIPAFGTEAFPTTSTSGFEQEPEDHDSFINGGGASQVQSWQFVNEEPSNCVHQSLNSSDCVSQTFVGTTGRVACDTRKSSTRVQRRLGQIQEQSNNLNMDDDVHYQGVISTIFKTTHQLILGPQFQNFDKRSSFTRWKRLSLAAKTSLGEEESQQKMLKKIIFEVPKMNRKELLLVPDTPEDSGFKAGDETANHALSERKRREKLNDRFVTLRSIVPSASKIDKVSILDDTIEYLQELQRRVQELESCRESTDTETRTTTMKRKKPEEEEDERASANCLNNKRKESHDLNAGGEDEPGDTYAGLTDNLRIGLFGNEVVIELRCAWREGILLEIMDVISGLNLDSHSVQSSTGDGLLCLTVNCKHKGKKIATGMIQEALQRVAWIC